MNTLVLANIAIEIPCSVLYLVIIACIMIGDSLRVRINRAFIWVLLSNIAVMLRDALAFYSIGKIAPRFLVSNFNINGIRFNLFYKKAE
jgi:hypothetical protein